MSGPTWAARLGPCMFFLVGKCWLGSKPGRVQSSLGASGL